MAQRSNFRSALCVVWRGLVVAVLLGLGACAPSDDPRPGQDVHLSTFCAASATPQQLPTNDVWKDASGSMVVVRVAAPCWVRVQPPNSVAADQAPLALVLTETQGLDVHKVDARGVLLARAVRGSVLERAFYVGQRTIVEGGSTAIEPVLLHLAIHSEATSRSQTETRLRWEPVYAVLPNALFSMSLNVAAAGALVFLILLSCVLALALQRPLFALAGCASLCNVQYLLGATGGYSALDLPTIVFAFVDPLLLAGFGMLLVFFARFCEFRRFTPRVAFAVTTLAFMLFGGALLLVVSPSWSLGYDIYEWVRPPAYGLLLYALVRGMWLRSVTATLCFLALVPDFVYMGYYTVPLLHWALGDTVLVNLPAFMQQGSMAELFTILWLPFVLCMALAHRVLTIERERALAALTDALTGLPNREGLRVKLRSMRGPYLSVVMDLNRFKSIDLALGRALGDRVLQGFASRLQRIPGAEVARLHADRFALIVAGTESIEWVQRQVDELLHEPLHVEGQVVDLSATLGLAKGERAEEMEKDLRKAEIALHQARLRHVVSVEYSEALEQPRRSDLSLMSDLHQAVAKNELRLYLQPKVCMADGTVSAAEGLVRWEHPVRGMVPPGEFINFAEQTGRIGFITRWMLGRAMEIAAERRAAGKPLQISVNVSAVDLADSGFVRLVADLAKQAGAQPCDIKLEITESAAMEQPDQAMAAMRQLRDLGFEWALDDFGTGYSSLSYLQKMPLSELKVDRAFVRDVTPDSEGATLLGSIIALGHQLGLTVVAEGAESQAEWQLLRSLGADLTQGWYAAKAMPLETCLEWCDAHPHFGV